jgi:hypothetical protein
MKRAKAKEEQKKGKLIIPVMMLALISLVVAAIGSGAAAVGLYLQKGQLSLQNQQLKRDLEKERAALQKETDYKREAADHGHAVACLVAIGRRWLNNNLINGSAFDSVFPDRDVRTRILCIWARALTKAISFRINSRRINWETLSAVEPSRTC